MWTSLAAGCDTRSVGQSSSAASWSNTTSEIAERSTQVEGVVEQLVRDLRVGFEQPSEVGSLVPRPHRVALHDPIRVVPGETRRHQTEQHRLAEHEAEARVEVGLHPFREHDEAGQAAGRVAASRSARVATSRAARSARPTSARCRARATARRPGDRPAGSTAAPAPDPEIVSAEIGLRLCGIADEPF